MKYQIHSIDLIEGPDGPHNHVVVRVDEELRTLLTRTDAGLYLEPEILYVFPVHHSEAAIESAVRTDIMRRKHQANLRKTRTQFSIVGKDFEV